MSLDRMRDPQPPCLAQLCSTQPPPLIKSLLRKEEMKGVQWGERTEGEAFLLRTPRDRSRCTQDPGQFPGIHHLDLDH